MGTNSHAPAVIFGLAGSISDLINKLERDLGVDGTGLTVLFFVVVVALIILLLVYNRASKKKALRRAHAGRFMAPDPFARSFRLQRSASTQPVPDPMQHGPARDMTNPRYRPEIQLPLVPDPVFPTLEKVRISALAAENGTVASGDIPVNSALTGSNPLAPYPPLTSVELAPPLSVPGFPTLAGPAANVWMPPDSSPPSPVPTAPSLVAPNQVAPNEFAVPPAPIGQSGFPALGDVPLAPITNTDSSVPAVKAAVAIATEAPLPGWYEDPEGAPGSLRYWDGNVWTIRRPA